jgi:hypothetical protein
MENYEKEILKQAGFETDKLTENQVYVILEPSQAPENYACDGEITPAESKARWLKNLKNSGLSQIDIMRARRLNSI